MIALTRPKDMIGRREALKNLTLIGLVVMKLTMVMTKACIMIATDLFN